VFKHLATIYGEIKLCAYILLLLLLLLQVLRHENAYFNSYYWFRVVCIHLIPCTTLVAVNAALINAMRRASRRRRQLLSYAAGGGPRRRSECRMQMTECRIPDCRKVEQSGRNEKPKDRATKCRMYGVPKRRRHCIQSDKPLKTEVSNTREGLPNKEMPKTWRECRKAEVTTVSKVTSLKSEVSKT